MTDTLHRFASTNRSSGLGRRIANRCLQGSRDRGRRIRRLSPPPPTISFRAIDRWWNPVVDNQAMECAIGSTGTTIVAVLVSSHACTRGFCSKKA